MESIIFWYPTFENCTCNYNHNDYIPHLTDVIVTADVGFVFEMVQYKEIGGMDYPTYYPSENPNYFSNNNTVFTIQFDLTGTGQFDEIANFKAICIEGSSEPEPEPNDGDILEFTKIYNPSYNQMKRLNEQVYYSGDSTTDLRQYIYNLYTIPYNIDSIKKLETSDIRLGLENTSIISNELSTSILSVDLGQITVPLKYNNVYDYDNVDCYLNIPNLRRVKLDSECVINQTISINYMIDLYTLTGTINAKSTFNHDEVFYSDNFIVGDVIPLEQKRVDDTQTIIERQVKNNILNSYIEVVRFIPNDSINLFGKISNVYDTLINYTGYIEVEKIVLNAPCNDDEKNEIEQLLKQGVIIK